MYKLSRYWNRFAYFIIHIARRLIWDYTGKNSDILKDNQYASYYTESILCNRKG